MGSREDGEPPAALRAVLAFGRDLRSGIEEVREQGLGAIVVFGCDERSEQLLSGGHRVDLPATADAILRAARDDSATVLAPGLQRIRWTNAMLNPDPAIEAAGHGTRHVVAERFAVQTGHPVIAVSEERRSVTLYHDHQRYVLRTKPELRDEVTDAMNALRTIVNLRLAAAGRQSIDNARKILSILDGHFVELGERGLALRFESVALAAALESG